MIDKPEKLNHLVHLLRDAPWIALDTEADSLHAYPEKLCLLQVSFPGHDVLVDPLVGLDLDPLLDIFHRHELVMHGGDYDLRLLRKTYDFIPTRIFDTMLAARLLGQAQLGLASLVERYLEVKLEKGPQKADWAQRPLTPRMAEYARHDTHYLKRLSDLLRKDLEAAGRLEWHRESCERFVEAGAVLPVNDPEREWRVKGSHILTPTGLAVLREIYYWRETEAVAANRPPYFVLMPEIMVRLADLAAHGEDFWPLIPKRMRPNRRQTLLHAIDHGLTTRHKPGPLRVRHQRLTEAQMRRYGELERRRDRRAADLDLEPSIIASRATLLALVRGDDGDEDRLMNWQREVLGLDRSSAG